MPARYLLKRRTIGVYNNRYKRGGHATCYGPWVRVAAGDLDELRARLRRDSTGLYDWAIFYRGKRLP